MTSSEIQNKLNSLRQEWKANPSNRRIIEAQAKCLQNALALKGSVAVAQMVFETEAK